MDFGAALQDGIEQLRTHALSAMRDTVFIDRVTGQVTDEVTLHTSQTYGTVYDGRGKIRRAGLQDEAASAGDLTVDVNTRLVDLPFDTSTVDVGDRLTITNAVHSPALQGWVFTIVAVTPRPFEVTLTVKRVVQDDDLSA